MPALAALEEAWVQARADAGFLADLDRLLRDFAGRPTPLYEARRLSAAVGHPVWLKREDLMHTGSHKLNNALGQGLLARRTGCQIIKAVRVGSGADIQALEPFRTDMHMLDASVEGLRGGTGQVWELSLIHI